MKQVANNLATNEERLNETHTRIMADSFKFKSSGFRWQAAGIDHNAKYVVTVNRDKRDGRILSGRKIETWIYRDLCRKLNLYTAGSSARKSSALAFSQLWLTPMYIKVQLFGKASLWGSTMEISCSFYRWLVFGSFELKAGFNRQLISVPGVRAVFPYYCFCQVFLVDMNTCNVVSDSRFRYLNNQ